jgi:hypothetical protein
MCRARKPGESQLFECTAAEGVRRDRYAKRGRLLAPVEVGDRERLTVGGHLA